MCNNVLRDSHESNNIKLAVILTSYVVYNDVFILL